MRLDGIKNTKRNLGFGMLSVILSMLLPFLTRTVMIHTLGKLFTGLSGLFQSFFQLLNIAELGFGAAIVYFMYQPIARNDEDTICALLNVYKKSYRIIGVVILGIGFIMLPFLPYMIHGNEIPDVNIYVVYVIVLLNSVVGYFFFPQKRSLLLAHQRNDIISKVSLCMVTIQNVVQMIILVIYKDYYLYALTGFFCEILNHCICAFIAGRKYPQYTCKGRLNDNAKKELINKIRGLFTFNIGSVISNFADSIVVSAFLGLEILAMYNNYFYVITAMFSILAIYYNAMRAGIGNTIVLDSVDKNYESFKKLQFVQCWLVGWITICMICLYQPFMLLWVGDTWLLPYPLIICFCVLFYLWKIQDIVTVYKEAAGLWDKDRYRPLISAGLNLLLNLTLVRVWGLYGVVISTIASIVFVDSWWVSKSLFQEYFHKSRKTYYINILLEIFLVIPCAIVTWYICSLVQADGLCGFVLKGLLCIIVPNLIYVLFHIRNSQFREIWTYIRKKGRKR